MRTHVKIILRFCYTTPEKILVSGSGSMEAWMSGQCFSLGEMYMPYSKDPTVSSTLRHYGIGICDIVRSGCGMDPILLCEVRPFPWCLDTGKPQLPTRSAEEVRKDWEFLKDFSERSFEYKHMRGFLISDLKFD